MKFFKHFTDASRGKSMQQLQRRYGFDGVGRYWRLVELCAEKLEKEKDEEYTEAHCVFEFERSYLMSCLGHANRKQTSCYLHALAELCLCSIDETDELFLCSMPKLLESMDRDAKRARPERAAGAPKKKIKRKKKEKEKEEDKESGFDFEAIYKSYPRHEGKELGLKRIRAFVGPNQDLFEQFTKPVMHYSALAHRRKTPLDKIKMFSSFVGTDDSRPWLEYVDRPKELDQVSAAASTESISEKFIREHQEKLQLVGAR